MKNCYSCENTLTDDAAYCYVCNTNQGADFEAFGKPVYNDTFLKVLCILTIIGAAISLISVPFNMATTSAVGYKVPAGAVIISILLAIGKLTGAILMLKKRLNGLYIYTVAAVLSIFMALYSVANVADFVGSSYALATGIISFLFLTTFLVMYWLPVNRRVLS